MTALRWQMSTHCEVTNPPQLLHPIHAPLLSSRKGRNEGRQSGGRRECKEEEGISIHAPSLHNTDHLACLMSLSPSRVSLSDWITPTCAALPYTHSFPDHLFPCGHLCPRRTTSPVESSSPSGAVQWPGAFQATCVCWWGGPDGEGCTFPMTLFCYEGHCKGCFTCLHSEVEILKILCLREVFCLCKKLPLQKI